MTYPTYLTSKQKPRVDRMAIPDEPHYHNSGNVTEAFTEAAAALWEIELLPTDPVPDCLAGGRPWAVDVLDNDRSTSGGIPTPSGCLPPPPDSFNLIEAPFPKPARVDRWTAWGEDLKRQDRRMVKYEEEKARVRGQLDDIEEARRERIRASRRRWWNNRNARWAEEDRIRDMQKALAMVAEIAKRHDEITPRAVPTDRTWSAGTFLEISKNY